MPTESETLWLKEDEEGFMSKINHKEAVNF